MSTDNAPAITYAPGSWTAMTTGSTWLLVDLGFEDPRVERCWGAVTDADPAAVLDSLLSGGLTSAPGFAIVDRSEDRVRLIVRHPASVVLATPTGPQRHEPVAGGTWLDLTHDGPTSSIVLAAPTETPRESTMPLGRGVTTAERVTVIVDPAAALPEAEVVADAEVVSEAADAVAEEPTGGADYDKLLFGHTVDRDALIAQLRAEEAAALAAAELEADQPVPAPAKPEPVKDAARTVFWDLEVTEPDSGAPNEDAPAPTPAPTPAPAPAPLPPPAGLPAALPSSPPAPAPTQAAVPAALSSGGVIDGLPWASGQPWKPEPPVAEPTPIPVPAPTPPLAPTSAPTPAPAAAASVLAVRCPQGHLTPTYSSECRVCGQQVAEQAPTHVPRPALGTLVGSNGEIVILDRGVIFGRAPDTEETDPATKPNLVQLTDSDEISRKHLHVTLDGWQPMIRDLGSANGTTLTLPGGQPQQLRPHQDYLLEAGATVTLAEIITFRYDVSA